MIHVVITRACNYNIMIASPSAAQVDAYVSCPLSSILLPNTYIEILKRAWTFLLPTDRLRQTCFTRLRPANDDLLHPFACTDRPRTAHAGDWNCDGRMLRIRQTEAETAHELPRRSGVMAVGCER